MSPTLPATQTAHRPTTTAVAAVVDTRATGRLLDISGIRLEDPAENIDRWRFHLFH